MALTQVRPPVPPAAEEAPRSRSPLFNPWLMLLAVAGMVLAYGWVFIVHPTLVAPTRDPAWYTWRANLLLHAPPDAIVRDWGPFGMFSGGYRVTTPVIGALLMRVAGVSRYTFGILVMVGVPALASLAIGGFAFRHRRDPLLFLLTLFAGGALFLTTVYVGYMDNIMCLFILAMTLPFLQPARTSWAARSAVALLMLCATLTHPTTLAIFVGVLMAGAGLHLLTSRFSIKKTFQTDGAVLISAAIGVVAGLAVWKIGVWGVKAPFADAALPPPYPMSQFKGTLGQWVMSLKPAVTAPLIAIALGVIAATALRRRGPSDEYDRMSALWLIPYIGIFGFVIGLTYPYYRFMNTTLAVMLLAGMGAWLAARYLRRRFGRPGWLGLVAIMVGFGWIFASGLGPWSSTSPSARWLDDRSRAAMASVDAYAAAESHDQPILFITNFRDEMKAWGWAKTYANAARAGLEDDQALRSVVYFGTVEDYFAFQPSDGQDPVYDRVSRGFFRDTENRLSEHARDPSVFLLRRFNAGTDNEQIVDSTFPPIGLGQAYTGAQIGDEVAVLTGPRAAPIDNGAVELALTAGEQEAAALADPPGRLSDPAHLLRVFLVIAFMLIVPGLLAARWFELEDGLVRLALIPGLSVALLMVSGVAVIAVHRTSFGLVDGVATILLACGIGAGLDILARRRAAGRAFVVPFVRRSLSLFENRNFGFLMGAVFLAVLGDGMVQAALAKTIAFGRHKGFDITNARSPREILGIVLLTYLPYTFISPIMGVLIDRFDRRLLLILANGVRAVAIALLGIAMATKLPDAALIAGLLLTLASTRLVLAIKSAGIPSVLGGRNLMQGNSISQAGSALSQLVGAGIAFAGTALAPAGVVVVAGAAVYGVGAFFASRVRHLETERHVTRFGQELRRLARDIADGLREVWSHVVARLAFVSFLALRALVSYTALVFALEIRQILGGGSSKKGIIIAGLAAAVGAGAGFVAAEQLKDRVRPERLVVAAMIVAGTGVVAFGGVVSVLGLSVVAFVAALAYFVGKISADTMMQQSLSDGYRGRGFSLFDIAYNLAWIVPALVLFALWDSSSPRVLLIGAGVLFLAAAAGVAGWSRRLGLADRDDQSTLEPSSR